MFQTGQNGGIARIVIDRIDARNAISTAGWRQLAEHVRSVVHSDAKLLVISGAGGAFCAGADLGEFSRLQKDETERRQFREDMRIALDALGDVEIPVVAWIEGPCYGAGVALAMACDLRIAAPSASFAITPAKIGISYPQQDVYRLVELVGSGQAARLLYSALSMDSAEAQRIGLVDVLAEDMGAMVDAIVANEGASLKLLKRSIRHAGQGKKQDEDLDRAFDDLIAGEALGRRLQALGRK